MAKAIRDFLIFILFERFSKQKTANGIADDYVKIKLRKVLPATIGRNTHFLSKQYQNIGVSPRKIKQYDLVLSS